MEEKSNAPKILAVLGFLAFLFIAIYIAISPPRDSKTKDSESITMLKSYKPIMGHWLGFESHREFWINSSTLYDLYPGSPIDPIKYSIYSEDEGTTFSRYIIILYGRTKVEVNIINGEKKQMTFSGGISHDTFYYVNADTIPKSKQK